MSPPRATSAERAKGSATAVKGAAVKGKARGKGATATPPTSAPPKAASARAKAAPVDTLAKASAEAPRTVPKSRVAAAVEDHPLPRYAVRPSQRRSARQAAGEAAKAKALPAAEAAVALLKDLVATPPSPALPAASPEPDVKDAPPHGSPIDFQAFAGNLARLVEEGGKAMAAYLRPREEGLVKDDVADDIADVMKTIGNVAEYWLADPQRTLEAQSQLIGGYLSLWSSTLKRLGGEETKPVAAPPARDTRFTDPEWSSNPFFDALKQTYLLTTNWAEDMVDKAEIDDHTKHKAEFYVRQIAGAISPSNFVLTNPELLRTTLASNGENLVRGMKMLAEDIEAGGGDLKIRQTDGSKFKVGENLAGTPGKVIFQNELMQLIQYAPQTEKVLATPLVIIPPWINKFYVLDLSPEKSYVRWAVEQGLTVFVVSWVNPGPELASRGFEDYMREGVLTAFEVAKKACGTKQIHAVGYCVGGTMLAITLGWLGVQKRDVGVKSASFLTTQVDFTHAGDLRVFIDEEQVAHLERKMLETGVLEGRTMANAFNMLRANDLIWPYVVNNYLKGQAPFPFDILYWNADSTRLPAANHSFYLRNCYLDNKLAEGKLMLAGAKIDLKKVDLPIYNMATREDHIAPAASVFLGLQCYGRRGRFVLAGSGHIAGVINPPSRGKYQYWTGPSPEGDLESWLEKAEMHPGSWWPDWFAWIAAQETRRVAARIPGKGPYPAIEDAPGSYVKVTS
ncbi:class I poly(R)-hydroxyalkanoic acid synthase [Ancylobacter pratisalsi]|uniref:class I poly(R)-hydroxyalkanoic acid synthase n=1 Tax=Ancylobacter pratisalsi TaxID=1745854 RepID=UPI001FE50786|nr:class I poly(R)-hydroxyalkanoic acid synthase [Ancylobacter pratisalsi]